jgi:phosphoglycolate phosphatase
MTTKKFDLIAFDWDGTLFDSTAIITRSIQAAVVDVGGQRPTDQAASYVIGMGLMQALAHAAPDVPSDKYPQLNERYKFHYSKSMHDITLFAGILELLATLKQRNHLLAVATGKSRRGLDDALQAVELKGIFHASRTADQTAGKPDPLMLHELMEELNVPPERTLMIGDTTHDLLMAQNAGCPSLAVSYGAHEPSSFVAFNPLYIAHSVAELDKWMAEFA